MAGSCVIGGLESVADLPGKCTSPRPYVNSEVNIYTNTPDFQTNASEPRRTAIKNGRFITDASDNPDQSDFSSLDRHIGPQGNGITQVDMGIEQPRRAELYLE